MLIPITYDRLVNSLAFETDCDMKRLVHTLHIALCKGIHMIRQSRRHRYKLDNMATYHMYPKDPAR